LEDIRDPCIATLLFIQAMGDDKSYIRWISAYGLTKPGKYSIKPVFKSLETKSNSVFVLGGAYHVFSDLKGNKILLKEFPVDKLLSALKNPG